ncbi:hypothetical protein ACEYW6_36030 [Nostoc sp. UIC 10607]|uniref:hypothetical protein n=1 Tax=Nostoc sp. UIC 10607 TaxID=3045935 RepID=UPI0039A0750D
MTLRSSREHSNVTTNSKISPKQTIPIDSTYPQVIQTLLAKCHDAGYPVQCVPASPVGDATRTGCRRHRLACGYYQVSLHGEDLGDWSELGVLAVLSGLQQEFYRGRLLLGLAVAGSG